MKNQKLLSIFILLFILCFISIQSIKAQSEFGVKGGILFSNINKTGLNSNLEFENKNGLSIGVFYKKRNLWGLVGFQGEFLYQTKGANVFIEKYESSEIGNSSYEDYMASLNGQKSYYRDKEILHYFSLPLLLTVKTTKFLDLYAGPAINYLLSMESSRIKTDNANRFSAGFSTGATIKLGNKTSLDFRYSLDLTPYDDMGNEQHPAKLKNQNFAVTIQKTLFKK